MYRRLERDVSKIVTITYAILLSRKKFVDLLRASTQLATKARLIAASYSVTWTLDTPQVVILMFYFLGCFF